MAESRAAFEVVAGTGSPDSKVPIDSSIGLRRPFPWRAAMLAAGPLAFAATSLWARGSLSGAQSIVLALTAWMAIWWITEPVPLAATALLPLVVFSVTGVMSAKDAASPFANEIIFLFLAGFLLAAALEKWRAHERLAYGIISVVGFEPKRLVLGIMLATGFLSMWISNTATAAMMYPIGLAAGSTLGDGEDARRTRTALMLGVAYAATIGGMGTLIGTPPNLIFAGAARELAGREIGFVGFMTVGMPIVIVLLPVVWALLVFVLFRSKNRPARDAAPNNAFAASSPGPWSRGEALTTMIFAATALAWFMREPKELGAVRVPGLVDLFPGLTDATVGLSGALLLFAFSAVSREGERRPLLLWSEARAIPWEVLLLFGGGLSLAAAFESSGLAKVVGASMSGMAGLPPLLLYVGIAIAIVALGELASNTAVATMAMPIVAALAVGVGEQPLTLMMLAAFASSVGFALPVATPPNAIVFGSGAIRTRDMIRAGLLIDAVAILVIALAASVLFPALIAR